VQLLDHRRLGDHRLLLPPLGFHLALLVRRALSTAIWSRARRFASIRTWE
jgi:hypothetical protein